MLVRSQVREFPAHFPDQDYVAWAPMAAERSFSRNEKIIHLADRKHLVRLCIEVAQAASEYQ